MRRQLRKPINNIEYGGQVRDGVVLPLRLRPAPDKVTGRRLEVAVGRRGPRRPCRVPKPLHKILHPPILTPAVRGFARVAARPLSLSLRAGPARSTSC
jgi:hypothetical protein